MQLSILERAPPKIHPRDGFFLKMATLQWLATLLIIATFLRLLSERAYKKRYATQRHDYLCQR